MEALIAGMSDSERSQLEKILEPVLREVWLPQPGKQSDAYWCEAEELLYGGAVGGGKTDLIAGLALTAHQKSLIFRRQSTDLDGFWTRLEELARPIVATNNNVKKKMITTTRKVIEGGHLDAPGAEKTWQGRPHDFIGFDEGAQLDELKVSFVIKWLRSTAPGQRQRMVIATNPPIPEFKDGKLLDYGSGQWLKSWFAPWLDKKFNNPAKDGEIRWCYMVADGERMKTIWVEAPGVYSISTGEYLCPREEYNEDDTDQAVARSRSFIRSKMKDNVYLKGSGYAERMSGTPEPLRSMLMNGDFSMKLEDNPFQVIPTNWVLHANRLWEENEEFIPALKQLVLCADIAQGGIDATTLAALLDDYTFDQVKRFPGKETPDGPAVVVRLLAERRDQSMVVLDGGGGWSGDTKRTLQSHHNIQSTLFQPSSVTGAWCMELNLKFGNLRAEAWWKMRTDLNPHKRTGIRLPVNDRLLEQLTTPMFRIDGKVLWVESKEDVAKRITGSSTDEADAVVMANYYREKAYMLLALRQKEQWGLQTGNPGEDFSTAMSVPLDDPLKDWNGL